MKVLYKTNCSYCGKEVAQRVQENKVGCKLFCNLEHYKKWRARNVKMKHCRICGTLFKTGRSGDNKKYCSRECAAIGQHGHKPWNKLEKQIRICACGCNQTFEVQKNSRKKFISKHYKPSFRYSVVKNLGSHEAFRKWCSRHENNIWWKGGNSDSHTYEFEHKIRYEALKRDNFKCQLCFASDDLAVHHINENKLDDRLENLITLCRSCHSNVHVASEVKRETVQSMIHDWQGGNSWVAQI